MYGNHENHEYSPTHWSTEQQNPPGLPGYDNSLEEPF